MSQGLPGLEFLKRCGRNSSTSHVVLPSRVFGKVLVHNQVRVAQAECGGALRKASEPHMVRTDPGSVPWGLSGHPRTEQSQRLSPP